MSKKMGVGLQDLFPCFTCIDATANVLWSGELRLRKKEGAEEVVEGVTLVSPQ